MAVEDEPPERNLNLSSAGVESRRRYPTRRTLELFVVYLLEA